MNHIATSQNESASLHMLAAQRELYSVAKRILAAQVILAVPIAIAWSLVVMFLPEAKAVAAFWGLTVTLLDLAWLQPWQQRRREQAAQVQEAFDCELLEIAWNSLKAGTRPEHELIQEYSGRYAAHARNGEPLRDWYPPSVAELPLHCARAVCQRANCWWDARQRRHYATWMTATIVAVTVIVFGAGLIGGLTVEKLFLAVIAPLGPVYVVGLRQVNEHRGAIARLDRLRRHAEEVFDAGCRVSVDASDSLAKSRALQDEIFESRRRSPLVFDWIFRRLRPELQGVMESGADRLVGEARSRLSRTV